ncbi:MAG: DNA polymerase III subunit gamma and tau [Canibacter sp.]
MATALYRRYRPDTFSQMIGQSHVTEPLMAALRSNKIGHAYLFSGPRGCGKTTSARILARCLNCAEGPTDSPCGVCESCVELSRDGGGSIDVVEIDAASHGSVEDARDLRERATFAPARDRYKIFIIDEAHMVTAHGFNALLKIVEEPPEHLKFIFATTEPEKVLGTIRSRTHHYPFRLIAPATLIDYTQQLADSENITVEPGVLPLLVRAGGGSARDTLSILDQLIAGSDDGEVHLDRAAALLGFTSSELIDEVISALASGDAARAFTGVDQVVQTGQDPRRFTEDLLQRLRDLIVVNATDVDGAAGVLRGVPEDQLQRMFEQAQSFGRGDISRVADIVNEALDHMAGASAPRMQLELMVARVLARVRSNETSQQSNSRQQTPQQPAPQQAPPRGETPPERQTRPPQAHIHPATTQGDASTAASQVPTQPATAPQTNQNPSSSNAAPNAAQALQQVRAFLQDDDAAQSSPDSDVREKLQSEMNRISTAPPSTAFLDEGQHTPAAAATQPPPAAPADPTTPAQPQNQSQPEPQEQTASQAQPAATEPAEAAADKSAAANTPERTQDAGPAPGPEAVPASDSVDPGENVAPGIDDLREVWSDVLEDLIQKNRAAFTAVDAVTPMALDDDILRIGLTSESDLEAFKRDGANPLREALHDALGVQLRYVPVKISLQTAREHRTPGNEAAKPHADEGDDPHRARAEQPEAPEQGEPAQPDNEPAPEAPVPDAPSVETHDPVLARVAQVTAHVQASPPTPAQQPASTELATEEIVSDAAQTRRPTAAERAAALGLAAGGAVNAAPVMPAAPAAPAETSAKSSNVSFNETEPAEAAPQTKQSMPEFVRYGEAVVREVFDAALVEERPLPENED